MQEKLTSTQIAEIAKKTARAAAPSLSMRQKKMQVNIWIPRSLRDQLVAAVWGRRSAVGRAPNGVGLLVASILEEWIAKYKEVTSD